MAILLFGLTGGVASGKSTVAARFREQGVPVLDADAMAHRLVEPGSEGLGAVVAAFGPEMLGPAGGLDRKRLGARVFADEAARVELERILHPRIRQATLAEANRLAHAGVTLACYEAALLVENELTDQFRPLVVVVVPAELQLSRLQTRDGLSEGDARQRIAAQLPLARKQAAADYLVDAAGTLEQTLARADEVLCDIRLGLGQGRWGGRG
jgi:dephospho-CoA kinase